MNFFKQKIKINNIHLIPGNGIDINYYDYHKRDNDKPSFLFLSRLVSSKGVFDYLNAAKEINKKHKEINFVLAGSFDKENPESIDFNKFNELIMNGPFNYIGEVQQKIYMTYFIKQMYLSLDQKEKAYLKLRFKQLQQECHLFSLMYQDAEIALIIMV